MIDDEMGASADFLHGVQMEHEHIKAWQLQAYLLTTHLLFGPRMVLSQLRRGGWRYPLELARYLRRARAQGFTPYGALTYFIFYGGDHLPSPLRVSECPKPGPLWRAAMAITRLWMGHSGAPEPTLAPGGARSAAAKQPALVPTANLGRKQARAT